MFTFKMPSTGDWISFVVVGVLAAFLLGYFMRGRGFGILGNLVVGVLGALLGGFLYGFVPKQFDPLRPIANVQVPLVSVIKAMIGAFILLSLASFFKKRQKKK